MSLVICFKFSGDRILVIESVVLCMNLEVNIIRVTRLVRESLFEDKFDLEFIEMVNYVIY